ncbi:catalase [Modestobacter sp. DSM 44400]|uniref:catalase n=1 Tax=Modestobacter sp. DSM 44400 TaxID=1550230 RepID=UPI00089D622D|nr:catalase [Modestobacter sp. DSM 44400]SDY36622.1 catalase [Modestobacter sp. DSM 44400]
MRSSDNPSGTNPSAKAVNLVEGAVEGVHKAVAHASGHVIPGVPGSEPPTVEEPTQPREPLPPKSGTRSPEAVSPTGKPTGAPADARGQSGPYLTTEQGVRLHDTDHSLKAGSRGPTLMQDHHFREKMMHFDHERIPERVVHARGAAAHGIFQSYGSASGVSCAGFLAENVETPVFVRFSNFNGNRGSADTVRDTRGFAIKFYTDEGNYDLVGNNIPVFFIQDAIKFPDLTHAAKPHPDLEIPQAQSAHDTFWDFVSLHTEAQHHTMWQMSDRGIPHSWRAMDGFGIHTFRLVNEAGETTLAKFHWKPKVGVHSQLWEEAQMTSGVDPDFHRRDLANAIETGAYPEWEMGIQTFPDTEDQMFQGIDLLDATKLVPEEIAPVQPIGLLRLDANPTNYFAETEQSAFHAGHFVRGIDATDDPLLQGRMFSYLDTQLIRLGGPNFTQIPINRPHAPVNSMLRDGWHQDGVQAGVAPYRPNSLDGGNPFPAGADSSAFIDVPRMVQVAPKVRESPASFGDHFSQPRMFWLSLSPVERDHTVRAYTFELGKCFEQSVKERQLQALANIDADLCAGVAAGLGLPAPAATQPPADVQPSPALSQVGKEWPTTGRVIGIVADESSDLASVRTVRDAVFAGGMVPLVIAPAGGMLGGGSGDPVVVQRTFLTARSVEFDAILLAGTPAPAPDATPSMDAKAGAPSTPQLDPRIALMLSEGYRHCKALGGWADSVDAFAAVGCSAGTPGVVLGEDPSAVLAQVVALLAKHRVWERFPAASR